MNARTAPILAQAAIVENTNQPQKMSNHTYILRNSETGLYWNKDCAFGAEEHDAQEVTENERAIIEYCYSNVLSEYIAPASPNCDTLATPRAMMRQFFNL